MTTLAGLYLSLGPVREVATGYIIVLGTFALLIAGLALAIVLMAASRLNEVVYDAARRAGRRRD